MSSLKDSIELLESDLKAVPPRISVYHDLPFAILRYDPTDEWELRREIKLLATRLEAVGKEVHIIPMSELLWQAIDETEGLEAVVGLERAARLPRGPGAGDDLPVRPGLESAVGAAGRAAGGARPGEAVVFLTRVAAMSPGIFHMSMLLDKMQGKTRVTTILFYPGSIEGTTGLRFMDLKDRDALGNYRVKIYG